MSADSNVQEIATFPSEPAGDEGFDSGALAEEFRTLVRQIEFGAGQPLLLAAHDMGAPPALLRATDRPDKVATI
jgi:hypothetical protein